MESVKGTMIEVYRGSAQTWECDAMGHLNVRYYMARVDDGLVALATELGLGSSHEHRLGRGLVAVEHHVRFHREVLPGAPLVMLAGILEASRFGLHVYFELRDLLLGDPAAAIQAQVRYVGRATREPGPLPEEIDERVAPLTVVAPEHGRPRGIELYPPRPKPSLDEADELGLWEIYRGPVRVADCDRHGFLTAASFMARLSEGMPSLFAALRGNEPAQTGPALGQRGWAALEYRLVYRSMPQPGDLLCVRSGLRGLGRKTLSLVHWVFEVAAGKAVGTAEAVSTRFDTETRRALPISDEDRPRLESRVIAGLTL